MNQNQSESPGGTRTRSISISCLCLQGGHICDPQGRQTAGPHKGFPLGKSMTSDGCDPNKPDMFRIGTNKDMLETERLAMTSKQFREADAKHGYDSVFEAMEKAVENSRIDNEKKEDIEEKEEH